MKKGIKGETSLNRCNLDNQVKEISLDITCPKADVKVGHYASKIEA
jgi:hypothetical protein